MFGPIYLFVLPNPSPSQPFHYWSHDRWGRKPLSRVECKYLGLPYQLSRTAEHWEVSWPASTYKMIYDYQVQAGFDPKTSDFARHLDCPMFEVGVPATTRFQEINGGSCTL